MNSPKIAVIISCDNNKNQIESCLNSVLLQDYHNKEIILIDDASQDNSWAKICELINRPQDSEDFITYSSINGISVSGIKHEYKTGLAGVLLTGANLCWKNVDFIGILRSTDKYLAGKISLSINYCRDIIDKVGIIYSDYETKITDVHVQMYRESFSRDRIDFGNSVIVTKNAIEKYGMTDLGKDNALESFWFKLTERFAAIHIPEILTVET
jgi:glycosyltransferase involved in cell wall biosynthesis